MATKSKQKQHRPSPKETPPPKKAAPQKDYRHWIAFGIVALLLCIIRLRLLNVPLERDEGEYAYVGRLILEGIAPYKEAYNMKLPGTYAMYALLMLFFGKTVWGIHFGLLLLNLGSLFFLYAGLRKFFNNNVALFTAAAYGLLSVTPSVLGFAAHATHFVVFFASAALFFLGRFYQKSSRKDAFLVGLMFGLSFLMKQQAVFFLVFGGLMILLYAVLRKPVRVLPLAGHLALYSAGVFLPYLLTLLWLSSAGVFDKFWFWTVTYASKYAAGATSAEAKALFSYSFDPMWKEFGVLWVLFFAGLVLTFFTRYALTAKLTAVLFALFAFLTICPGFYFRQHYFVTLLPAIGLLSALTVDFIGSWMERAWKLNARTALSYGVLALVFITTLSTSRDYYFQLEPNEVAKMKYGSNPFIEAQEVANYIKQHTAPTDRIAVVGSEPEILFYADRPSATGYIYTYGLMELHSYNKRMQEEMIAEIEKNKPKYVVFVKVPTSWLFRQGSPTRIFEWSDQYTRSQYDFVGIADIVSDYQTVYKWDAEVAGYAPKSENFLLVYKRKT